MSTKVRQVREVKAAKPNLAVCKNWWKPVQSVESIRQYPDERVAVFWLGMSLQALSDLSVEFGHSSLLEALPPEQSDLLDMILPDGEDLAAPALDGRDRLFGE